MGPAATRPDIRRQVLLEVRCTHKEQVADPLQLLLWGAEGRDLWVSAGAANGNI